MASVREPWAGRQGSHVVRKEHGSELETVSPRYYSVIRVKSNEALQTSNFPIVKGTCILT